MRSAARLTYNQAYAALFEGRPEARAQIGPLVERLMPLVDVYRVLLKARHKRGALEFDAPEPKFVINAAQQITGIDLPLRNDAHKLIEECMVLANVATARELGTRSVPTLYRVHAEPDARKLDMLVTTLRALGIGVEFPPEITTRDLQKIAPRIKDPAARPFIETLVVRSMMQAVYQPENIGHFGLALKHYAHFTSPIRRYPDLVVHRTIKAMVSGNDPAGRRYEPAELEQMGLQLTQCEKRADEADRYVDSYLKCVYLRDRIGQTFEGSDHRRGGFRLLRADHRGGGRRPAAHRILRDDEYFKDDALHAWVGTRTGRRLQLGSHVRVIVTAVNPVEGLVDLDLVVEPAMGKQAQAMSETALVFGLHAVRSLLLRSQWARAAVAGGRAARGCRACSELLQLAQQAGIKTERVDAKAMDSRVGNVVHQGVVAEVEPLPPWHEDELVAALSGAKDPLVLVLDGVQDPHNLGACLRTADACGALAVVVPKDRAASMNATVRKVAAGAADTTPIATVTNLARSLKLLKEAGLWIVGADMAGEKLAWQADLRGRWRWCWAARAMACATSRARTVISWCDCRRPAASRA